MLSSIPDHGTTFATKNINIPVLGVINNCSSNTHLHLSTPPTTCYQLRSSRPGKLEVLTPVIHFGLHDRPCFLCKKAPSSFSQTWMSSGEHQWRHWLSGSSALYLLPSIYVSPPAVHVLRLPHPSPLPALKKRSHLECPCVGRAPAAGANHGGDCTGTACALITTCPLPPLPLASMAPRYKAPTPPSSSARTDLLWVYCKVCKRGFLEEVRDVRERAMHSGALVGVGVQPGRRWRWLEGLGVSERRGDIEAERGLSPRLQKQLAAPLGLPAAVHRGRHRHRCRQGELKHSAMLCCYRQASGSVSFRSSSRIRRKWQAIIPCSKTWTIPRHLVVGGKLDPVTGWIFPWEST
ncbi:hypothetical protein BHE74_00035754 [Ensete ventricosum]|nr:hypothetical protein BHE74_00035754 [Ensete ventricosum]